MTRLVLVGGAAALGEAARAGADIDVHTAPAGGPLVEFVNALVEPHDVVLFKGAHALGLEAVARQLATLN